MFSKILDKLAMRRLGSHTLKQLKELRDENRELRDEVELLADKALVLCPRCCISHTPVSTYRDTLIDIDICPDCLTDAGDCDCECVS